MLQGSVASYMGRQHLGAEGGRGKQQLILGPWLHGGPTHPQPPDSSDSDVLFRPSLSGLYFLLRS